MDRRLLDRMRTENRIIEDFIRACRMVDATATPMPKVPPCEDGEVKAVNGEAK